MYVEDVEDIKTSHNRCILKYVEDVKDRSNTHKGCNAMYVEDVADIKTSHNRCILKYVEDVEDRSNTCDRIRIRLCVCSGALPSNYLCELYAHPGTPMYIQAPLLSIKQHAISL